MAESSRATFNSKPNMKMQLQSYFINHLRVFLSSLGRLYQFPGPSIMTIVVIAIALALPAGFYVILQNAQYLSNSWDGAIKLSLYLKTSTSPERAKRLANHLSTHAQIDNLNFISRQDSLAEFRANSGFNKALNSLRVNPLPAVITISPIIDKQSSLAIEKLKQELAKLPEVDIVKLDMQWVKRLIGIINIVQRAILVLACMLSIAVILVISNTIRLDIQNRVREIHVQKLIGATNAFVRRPFLYTGFWYGTLGSLLAWILVNIGLFLLSAPIQHLAKLYQSEFELNYLSSSTGFLMIFISISLGYIGSWLAVGHHLKDIKLGQ